MNIDINEIRNSLKERGISLKKPRKDNRYSDYISFHENEINKKLDVIRDEVSGITAEEKYKINLLIDTLCEQPNPEYSETGSTGISKTITYIPTIIELNVLYNNGLGTKYESLEDGEIFYLLEVPPLEDIIGERDIIKIYGKNKQSPYYTLWSSPNSEQFELKLKPVVESIV